MWLQSHKEELYNQIIWIKEKKISALGPIAIKHLTKCVSYAVKGNTKESTWKEIWKSSHMYVYASLCEDWCG